MKKRFGTSNVWGIGEGENKSSDDRIVFYDGNTLTGISNSEIYRILLRNELIERLERIRTNENKYENMGGE